jgi:Flp pilus assembly protein protease CpaA
MQRFIAANILWKLLAVLPLLSGAALLIFIITSISLGLLLIIAGLFITAIWSLTWRALTPRARAEVARRAAIGFAGGIVATIAYDLSRWIGVTVFQEIITSQCILLSSVCVL